MDCPTIPIGMMKALAVVPVPPPPEKPMVGAAVNPDPGDTMVMELTPPLARIACAVAVVPPPPVNVTVGVVVKPDPVTVTEIVAKEPGE